jgi:hypothetical protein
MARKLIAPGVFALGFAALIALMLSGLTTTRAVQNPTISFDMVTTGNTYDDTTNTMTVGSIEDTSSTCPANNSLHTHATHVVITNVEDLIGWQVRLNYIGDRMRPNAVNFAPFFDSGLFDQVSFNNLPIDPIARVHRSLVTATSIPPAAPGAQTASFGASYGGVEDFAISPDTPPKSPPDDTSYSAPSGGVLARLVLQVLPGNAGQTLTVDMDDGVPNSPGSAIAYFDGVSSKDSLLPESSLGDGTHLEGFGCTPPPTPPPCAPHENDCDGDGVPNATDNCPSWPNPDQNLPPWNVPADDPDCDGFSTSMENAIGTNPNAHCGVSAWPPDLDNDTYISIIGDVVLLTGNFARSVPPAPARYDMAPEPPDGYIDIFDITRALGFRLGQSCAS